MSKWIPAAGTIVAAIALAFAGVYAIASANSPDKDLGTVLRDAPKPNGADGVVDYGNR